MVGHVPPTHDDRRIAFEFVFNFRDLGGLTTVDGARVRRGSVFRSDTLSRLSANDQPAFEALRVRTVIDLRRESEVAAMGRVPEWTGARWRHHHLNHAFWDHSTYTPEIGVARWLADRYHELLEQGAADIVEVIELLADDQSGPTVVHCVAGKDRTGLISALTLELLGVSDELIAHDYELTELSEPHYLAWLRRTDPAQAAQPWPAFYSRTPAHTMLLTLTELRQRHGSVRSYLTGAGLSPSTVTALRRRMLEG
jgi:protein-tyrosine phosphatase